jgi:hypothetical protein
MAHGVSFNDFLRNPIAYGVAYLSHPHYFGNNIVDAPRKKEHAVCMTFFLATISLTHPGKRSMLYV